VRAATLRLRLEISRCEHRLARLRGILGRRKRKESGVGLCIKRRPGESVHIGPDITVTVVELLDGHLRLVIDAPSDIIIRRAELSAGEARGLRRKEGRT
jgi:carbon storage regulator CsrA